MNKSYGGADRGNKLVREKGFKGTSYGSAGPNSSQYKAGVPA